LKYKGAAWGTLLTLILKF